MTTFVIYGKNRDRLGTVQAANADAAVTEYNRTKIKGAPWGKAAVKT
jgi:hypothetical protein